MRILRDSFVLHHFLQSLSLFAQDEWRGRNGDRHPPSPACPRTITCPGAATSEAAGQTDTGGTLANAVDGGHGTDKDLKQQQPQHQPLRNTRCHCSPLDIEPPTAPLQVRPSCRFLICQAVHPLNPSLSSLDARVSCGQCQRLCTSPLSLTFYPAA